jgi:hypothetical protein
MRVRLLCSIAGTPTYAVGEIVTLGDEVARAWIADGLAAPADDGPEMATASAPVVTRTRGKR